MPRILIIEDDEEISDLLRARLEGAGHLISQALDGESGLAEIESFRPDLVILDLNIPHVDGFEVCRRMRERESMRTIPVIMMTAAYPEPHRQTFGRVMGANEYLLKPVKWDTLAAAVGRFV